MATAMRVVPLSEDIGAKVKFAVRTSLFLPCNSAAYPLIDFTVPLPLLVWQAEQRLEQFQSFADRLENQAG